MGGQTLVQKYDSVEEIMLMGNDLKANLRRLDAKAIIDMKGEVTSLADQTLNVLVNSAVVEGVKHVVFNFTDVSYINSSGIAVLIGIVTSLASRGVAFNVYGLTPHFKKIFRMIGLTQYVKVLGSEADALAAF
jgi:anti-anti-sigma factor